MKNARFWTGLVFFTGVPMSLVMGTVVGDQTKHSAVEGRVTHNGRPIAGGMILLESTDRKQCGDLILRLDPNGRFAGEAEWSPDFRGHLSFRAHIYPDRDSPGNEGLVVRQDSFELALAPGSGRQNEPDYPVFRMGPEPTRIHIDLRN